MTKCYYSFKTSKLGKFKNLFSGVFGILKKKQLNACAFLLLFSLGFGQFNYKNYSNLFKDNPNEILNRWQKDYKIEKDASNRADLLIFVSEVYRIQGDYNNMIVFIDKAAEEAENVDDKLLHADLNSYRAYAYFLIDALTKSEELTLKQIELAKGLNNEKDRNLLILDAYSQLGSIKKKQKKYPEAIENYKKGLSILKRIENLDTYNYADRYGGLNNNISATFTQQGNLDSAKFYIKKVEAIPNLHNEIPRLYGISQLALGELSYQNNKLEEAQMYFQNALPIFEKDKYSDKLLKLYRILNNLYTKRGDREKALKYEKLQMLQTQQLDYNKVEAVDVIVNNLEKDREKAEKKAETRIAVIWCLIAFSLSALVGLYVYLKRKKEKQKLLYQQIISKLELQLNEKNTITDINFLKENQYQKSNKQPIYQNDEAPKTSFISDTTEQELIKKLQKFEKSEKFTNKELSISLLAIQLGTNTKYLSEVISKHYNKNYNTYINELRIDYICKKIATDPKFRKYKITYLAEVCGFSSYNTFTTIFKNTTGMSPSSFLKEAILQDLK